MLPYKQIRKNLPAINMDLHKLLEEFTAEIEQNPEMLPVRLAQKQDDLQEIEDFAHMLREQFKTVVILAIGGSSLGGKTLTAVDHSSTAPKLIFVESIDSQTINNLLNTLDWSNTAFLSISKSGNTVEILAQWLIILEQFIAKYSAEQVQQHFFVLTKNQDNTFQKLAKQFSLTTLTHLENVGGRFSYTSNVGLLPAAIAGLNIRQIRAGAAKVLNSLLSDPLEQNEILQIAVQQNDLYHYSRIAANIVMPYADCLAHLTEWYRQLWAESLGKQGFCPVPINAIGTVDQHSQLQLYLDGPRDKFYTFITKTPESSSLKIRNSFVDSLQYLEGRTLDEIMQIEANSTIQVLEQRQLPIRILQIPTINEEIIGALMMQFMLETLLVGKLNHINPFGQPCVEEKKVIAQEQYQRH